MLASKNFEEINTLNGNLLAESNADEKLNQGFTVISPKFTAIFVV